MGSHRLERVVDQWHGGENPGPHSCGTGDKSVHTVLGTPRTSSVVDKNACFIDVIYHLNYEHKITDLMTCQTGLFPLKLSSEFIRAEADTTEVTSLILCNNL